MNRTTTRFLLGCLGLTSVCCLIGAGWPRIQAWNTDSKRSTVATIRADTCLVTSGTLVANSAITNADGRTVPDGTYLCDWSGNTAQVTNHGFVGYLRSGKAETISQKLKSRGFKP
jgi:hypothetical protein